MACLAACAVEEAAIDQASLVAASHWQPSAAFAASIASASASFASSAATSESEPHRQGS